MKFMKLGSKPDLFQTNGDNIRYVATELATDIVINVGDVKFYLHKFPLLSRSARLQKLVAVANEENNDEIQIHDIPGGPAAFEICAKFCYGMIVTLNAYNVIAARCAAEYLEMYETADKGNLIYKIEVFLNSSIFRTWKDSIIVFQTTKSLLPWSEELKVVNHCLESIASKASIDPSKVEWSYTYNRRKNSENGNDTQYNSVTKKNMVPRDWWVEDLCELPVDFYKRVIATIKTKEQVSAEVIGESLKAYAHRRLPGFSKGTVQTGGDDLKSQTVVEALVSLLPMEKNSVPCAFLFRLLQASMVLDSGETDRREVMRRISQQLDEATVADLLIRAPSGEKMVYNIDLVRDLVGEFVMQERSAHNECPEDAFEEVKGTGFISDASKAKVAKLVDVYLVEVARDPNVPVSKFVDLAEMVSGFSRPSHDGLYRAIDMYLKEHPGISKSERKRMCKLMDCKKLSADACMHAVQNERLPLRVVVQVLFFEQMRAAASSGGGSTPDLQGSLRALLPAGSHGSSRSATTNTDDDFDSMPTTEELKALKGELASLRLRDRSDLSHSKVNSERAAASKLKGLVVSRRMLSKLWSSKERHSEKSSSDTSESPCSTIADDTKSTPSRSRRQSLS